MKLFKFNKIPFYLSIFIASFCSIISLLQIFFFLEIIKLEFLFWGVAIFICSFCFSYLLLSYRYNNLIIERISELYRGLFPATTSTSILKSSEDIELLTKI